MELSEIYRQQVADGALQTNASQIETINKLQKLEEDLRLWQKSATGWSWITRNSHPQPPGLYLHGAAGRGKTMLMDLFFAHTSVKRKRRAHFQEFIADLHDRIRDIRLRLDGDPIPIIARSIAKQPNLLCFDEFQVSDIVDAMLLGRLFKAIFEQKIVTVATSNAHPSALYKDGLNRQLLLPFIERFTHHMRIIGLSSERDFRLDKLIGRQLYFAPANEGAARAIDAIWREMTESPQGEHRVLDVKGRKVEVPQAAKGVARFCFDDICGRPYGMYDYLAVADNFHTVIIENIPRLPRERRSDTRRFISLIDTLYDSHTRLVISADAEPTELYVEGHEIDIFPRAASRLMEMRGQDYLSACVEQAAQDMRSDARAGRWR